MMREYLQDRRHFLRRLGEVVMPLVDGGAADERTGGDVPQIDRGAILAEIYRRNALRIEAKLPRLDVRAEFEHAVLVRAWRQHTDRHHERIQAEILAQQRARHGEGWGLSWGGRMALSILTRRALEASFRRP